jgi:hypothetical protein
LLGQVVRAVGANQAPASVLQESKVLMDLAPAVSCRSVCRVWLSAGSEHA